MGGAFSHKKGVEGKYLTLPLLGGNVLGTMQPYNKKQMVKLRPGKSLCCSSRRDEEHPLSLRRDSRSDKPPPPLPGGRNPALRRSRAPNPTPTALTPKPPTGS